MAAPHLLKDASQFDAARLILDFTVPSGTARTFESRHIQLLQVAQDDASRNSGESLVRADCTCELNSPSNACSSGRAP